MTIPLAWCLLAGVAVLPPELLTGALRQDPELVLLDPPKHLPGDYSVDDLHGFGYWPPWRVTDLDRDGKPDVVAVVVRPGAASTLFGVVAVHARDRNQLHWVEPLGKQGFYGVAAGPASDTVMPLHCVECDTNSWYRWTGRMYGLELYAVGETVAIATYEEGARLGLFEQPSRTSRLRFPIEPCARATVLRAKGDSYEGRWYFVQLSRGRKHTRGWIPSSFAAESECIG